MVPAAIMNTNIIVAITLVITLVVLRQHTLVVDHFDIPGSQMLNIQHYHDSAYIIQVLRKIAMSACTHK